MLEALESISWPRSLGFLGLGSQYHDLIFNSLSYSYKYIHLIIVVILKDYLYFVHHGQPSYLEGSQPLKHEAWKV